MHQRACHPGRRRLCGRDRRRRGHSQEIAKRLTTGRLVAIDQDPDAILAAGARLSPYPQATLVRSNFSRMAQVLGELGISKVDGVLLDIGVSSISWIPERGFSYHADAAA